MSDTTLTPKWTVGQRAVIDGRQIVTVERVTPSGRVTAGGKQFHPDGRERGVSYYDAARIQALTPEIEAEVSLAARSRAAGNNADEQVRKAEKWLGKRFFIWGDGNRVTLFDIEKAERLAVAIQDILGDET